MKGDYSEQMGLIFKKMVEAFKTEKEQGRHPHVKLESYSQGAKLYDVRIESEQISERLELRPAEFVVFAGLLKQNGIELQR